MSDGLDDIDIAETLAITERRVGQKPSASQMAPADLARHIAKGQQRLNSTDYDAKIAVIAKDMEKLNGNQLDVIAAFVLAMRRRSWGLSASPPVDEQPEPEQLGPCTSWTPDKPVEGFDGTETNPMPLDSPFPENQHSTYANDEPLGDNEMTHYPEQFVESLPFSTLLIWADIVKVPHDEDQWIDDEWPDKEDELRVAVAEAMGKVGK